MGIYERLIAAVFWPLQARIVALEARLAALEQGRGLTVAQETKLATGLGGSLGRLEAIAGDDSATHNTKTKE